MNRSPSIVVMAALLVLSAVRLLKALPAISTNSGWLVLSVSFVMLAALSIFTAVELWQRSQRAFRLFVVWLIAYLLVGGATQVITAGTAILEVAIWFVFVGALGLAVASHLRYVLRQTA